jgi:hypothetical protein
MKRRCDGLYHGIYVYMSIYIIQYTMVYTNFIITNDIKSGMSCIVYAI